MYRTRTKAVSSKPIFNAGTERFMRDWRSGIVTITVRDQRMRQHDPILGVVPLKLSDILQTSSQVTRWYPMDGGIGFGRVRVSLLFRSVETRLPINQLGWDVGTFEFTSDKIIATGYNSHAKLKMRTGGSSGKISKAQCRRLDEGDGMYWDITKRDGKNSVRLPVRYRYRSPVIFEFHKAGHRSAEAYAVIWLHHLEDNREEHLSIPIWKTDNGMRVTQNYITEENLKSIPNLKIEEIGRLQFRSRFKAGTDEDHSHFVTDSDSRETQETWEACNAEGVRGTLVTKDLPPAVQQLHDQSLTQGRDVLSQAPEEEKKKWLSKDGTDWSGAFGQDPADYIEIQSPRTVPHSIASSGISSDKRYSDIDAHSNEAEEDDDDDYTSSDSSDLGLHDASTNQNFTPQSSHHPTSNPSTSSSPPTNADIGPNGKAWSKGPLGQYRKYKYNKKDLHRKQRGLMQWKPARNLAFAGDNAKFAVRRGLSVGKLSGRQPGVETEV